MGTEKNSTNLERKPRENNDINEVTMRGVPIDAGGRCAGVLRGSEVKQREVYTRRYARARNVPTYPISVFAVYALCIPLLYLLASMYAVRKYAWWHCQVKQTVKALTLLQESRQVVWTFWGNITSETRPTYRPHFFD